MYRVCIILWDGAIIGVYTKEKIINTYPPLFKSAPAQWCAGADFFLYIQGDRAILAPQNGYKESERI